MTYSKNSATNVLTSSTIAVMLLMGTSSFIRPFSSTSQSTGLPSVTTASINKKDKQSSTKVNPHNARPKFVPRNPDGTIPGVTPTPTPTPGTPGTPAGGTAPGTGSTGGTKPGAKPASPSPAPTPAPAPAPTPGAYPLHTGIRTTMFWAGEDADASNGFIQNFSSAWQEKWSDFFGGIDDPNSRCGWNPCAFTPKENPFYFALPFSDYGNSGPKSNLTMVYWSHGALADGQSILKNRWIEVSANGKTLYAQWEDVGPYNEDDSNYVFGSAAPRYSVGLDLSPAANDYLGIGGWGITSWRFVEASQVPAGPWKTTVTTSGPNWN